MIVFSIDPSSTTTGIAVMDSEGQKLLDFGKLKLTSKEQDLSAYERIDRMCEALDSLLDSHYPDRIVVESTSGHVGNRHKGAGAGLAIYGVAVGALWKTAENWAGRRYEEDQKAGGSTGTDVILIPENEWTRKKKKSERTANIKLKYPAYNKKYGIRGDAGGDVADAIGIAEYYINTLKLQGARLWNKK